MRRSSFEAIMLLIPMLALAIMSPRDTLVSTVQHPTVKSTEATYGIWEMTRSTPLQIEPNDVDVVTESSGVVLSEEEIDLVALLTMAEAEGECEEGKRLVIDTVLNRMESEAFPDTVQAVIYQKNHFSSMWNGRVDRVSSNDYVRDLVREELLERTNHEVIYFNAGHYSKYGTPLFQVGGHCFSKE